ncbi:MAG TPA: DEAD/DEAH box helicase [Methylomirabilota bacterium]|nr:DEAD/DEAH box helicase [Methylomirabilota bacterium]
MTTKLFSELGLSEEIQKAIDKLGFEKASPIQAETIPLLMEGKDLFGQSQTGSGKTAAFAIPAIEKVDTSNRAVQALILTPTRELAIQVSEEVHKLAFFKRGIHALPIYGGQSYDRQFYGLKQGAQIVIGTPGRVMDHMRRGTLKLEQTKLVILDEADVMLDMGFREDIEVILKAVPKERQTVFFSATLSRTIKELIETYAREPQHVRIEQKTVTVPTVEQTYYEVDRRFKVELLTRLIDIHDLKLGIIFCNTKRMVDDLVEHLNAQGYSADRLHGDMTQAMRDRVMQKFRKSGLEFLVATDVAARGIDVDDVQVVFNYDLPYDVEDYVHRIGRTGRAGRSGRAISFVAGRELFQIHQIERYTKTRIHRAKIPTQTEVEQARDAAFITKVRETLQTGEYKKQDQVISILLEEGFSSTDIASALIHHLQGDDTRKTAEPPPRNEFREERERDDRRGRFDRGDRGPRERRGRDDYGDRRAFAAQRREFPAQPREGRMPERPAAPVGTAAAEVRKPAAERAPAAERKPLAPRSESPRPERPLAPKAKAPWPVEPPTLAPKSRKTPENQTRLHVNVGAETGATREELLRLFQGETGLPAGAFGYVDIRERHAFVDVVHEHAKSVVSKLNRTQFKTQRLKVKMRSEEANEK